MARQILVIDDSSTMRQSIEWTFAFEDFVVASATSFQEAISDIDVVQPDVILLDHELGETTLDEAVGDIAARLGRQPTVILMHQHDLPLTQSELERVHATAQVPKPFETQRLIDTVKWSLGMPITPSVAASRAYRWTPPTESPDISNFEIPEPPSIPAPSLPNANIPEPSGPIAPPAIISPPPVEEEQAPAIIAPPPIEAEQAPAIIAPPPVEEEQAPAIIAPPPVEEAEPPAIIAPPPVEAAEPPAIIAPPPVEEAPAPAIIAPPETTTDGPQLVQAPPVFRAPPPPVLEAQDSGPSQHAPFHPEHEPEIEENEIPPVLSPPLATGTTEIDVAQLSLDDEQLDALGSLGADGLEPDDFFAPPTTSAPEAVEEVIAKSSSELVEQLPSDSNDELERLAHQIVERVAWEIIPDIVERVVRERLNRDD